MTAPLPSDALSRTPDEGLIAAIGQWVHDYWGGKHTPAEIAFAARPLLESCAQRLRQVGEERDGLRQFEGDVSRAYAPVGVYFMDPPDGGSVELPEQIARLVADWKELRSASPAPLPEAVAADSRRLDWLEQEGPGIDYPSGSGVRLYWGASKQRTPAHETVADNWRAAIDAAMSAAPVRSTEEEG
jgi:hypothetical protein